jgi:hypothetical protein
VSGCVSLAQESKQVGFVQAIATPHASARSTWCASGASGWISHSHPSAHRPQDRIADRIATLPGYHRDVTLLTDLDAFYLDHRTCGDLDAGTLVAWAG